MLFIVVPAPMRMIGRALTLLATVMPQVAQSYPSLPSNNDVFIGTLTCGTAPTTRGMRVTFSEWPQHAIFDYYELTGSCRGSLNMSVDYDPTDVVYNLRLSPIATWLVWNCSGQTALPPISFSGNLRQDNMNWAGVVTSGCTSFTADRKIGWRDGARLGTGVC